MNEPTTDVGRRRYPRSAVTFQHWTIEGGAGEIEVPRVTVIVGPNNTGKSLFLQELHGAIRCDEDRSRHVLRDILFPACTDDDAIRKLETLFRLKRPDGRRGSSHGMMLQPRFSANADAPTETYSASIKGALSVERSCFHDVLGQHLSELHLARDRHRLVDNVSIGRSFSSSASSNHVAELFLDEEARDEVSRMVYDTFQQHAVIDATDLGAVSLRLADFTPPPYVYECPPKGQAAQWMQQHTQSIDDASDGVQAFVGLIAVVRAASTPILLVDEPEAFLHPTLTRVLARDLVRLASARGGHLVVATHSADFLQGCVEENPDAVGVLRLTREAGQTESHFLPASDLRKLVNRPLFRSIASLRGPFFRGAVLVEADGDRALYEQGNRQLRDRGKGAADVLFLPTYGWNQMPELVEAYRKLGLATAAVVDLDAVADAIYRTTSWKRLMAALHITADPQVELLLERLRSQHASDGIVAGPTCPQKAIDKQRSKLGDRLKQGQCESRELNELIGLLATKGLFLVKVGELERWIPSVPVPPKNEGGKAGWLGPALDHLVHSQEPDEMGLLDFVDAIGRWINETASRKGAVTL